MATFSLNDEQGIEEEVQEKIPPYSWYVLALLCLVYLMNFLDRTLIYILFPPIKREMVLSDLQLALLGTTSFVIFYTALGIPFGHLADRVVRKTMIAIGLAVWSLFSGLTGFATDFWTIFGCRVMVGVGEATLGPAAMSLLSDFFPKRLRATVQSIYSAGIPLGAAAAFFLGGALAEVLSWRWAFYLLGFPGLILTAFVLFIHEPPRGIGDNATSSNAANAAGCSRSSKSAFLALLSNRALVLHHTGYALFAVATNSLSIWVPTLLNRAHEVSLVAIGTMTGMSMLVAGGLGTAFGGYIADWFKKRLHGGRMLFTALSATVCAPLWLVFLLSGNLTVMIVCYVVLTGFGLVWLGPGAADVHDIVGPQLRGLGVGVYFFVVNIIGYGLGPPIIGQINDMLGVATNPWNMHYGLLICPIACLGSALLLYTGAHSLQQMKKHTAEAMR
ncbi:MAG: MFS transporter [Bacteroidota bacterium]|nr:MFS transporter [Candidatus Kapabacteria bacterium]MDW8218890.1 MFS transporter [Bacteroidota bacterium]